mmetsp:Transcript_98642/g.318096  ORF Transcript_98642/g.318096 Transcript_98642/m.318096 type:complete len:467 (+) Transcript_98642:2222-3622(+)
MRLVVECYKCEPVAILECLEHRLRGVFYDVEHRQAIVLHLAVLCFIGRRRTHRARNVDDTTDVGRSPHSRLGNLCADHHRHLATLASQVSAGSGNHKHCLLLLDLAVIRPLIVVHIHACHLRLLVELVVQIQMHGNVFHRQLPFGNLLGFGTDATSEDTLNGLHRRSAYGTAAGTVLHGCQALLATALMPARHHQEVCKLLVADGTRVNRDNLNWVAAIGIWTCAADLLQTAQDALVNLSRLQGGVDLVHLPREQRQDPASATMEHLDAPAERVLVIAVAAHDARSDLGWWRQELQVVDVASDRIDTPVCSPCDERFVRRLQEEHTVDVHVAQQSFGLICGAWETVQQATSLLHVRLAQTGLHQTHHHVVWHEAIVFKELFGPHAQFGAALHEVTEHIACRKVHEAEPLREQPALRALTRSRWTHHNEDPALGRRALRSASPIVGGGGGAISGKSLFHVAGRCECT